MPTTAPDPSALRPRFKWLRRVAILLTAAALAFGGGFFAYKFTNSAKPQIIQPNSTPASPATDTPVQTNGSFSLWQPAHFADNGEALNREQTLTLIQLGLKDPHTLRTWQLCSAELHAEVLALYGLIKASADFPLNKPYNKPMTEDEKKGLAQFQARHDALAAAVGLADDEHVDCTKAGGSDKLRWADFNLGGRPAQVSDYDVVPFVLPLEFHLWRHSCASDMQGARDRTATHPLDEEVNPDRESFSEVERAFEVAQFDATAELLRQRPETDC